MSMFLNVFCQDGFTSRFNKPYCFLQLFICGFVCLFVSTESSLRAMSCDVVVVGGGISGMYMAETLMRMKKEDNVCLFERDSRFGGRVYDYRFSQAPNISISKLVCCHPETRLGYFQSVFGGGFVFVVRDIFPFYVESKEAKNVIKKLFCVFSIKRARTYYPSGRIMRPLV